MKKILFIPWTLTNGGGSEKILYTIINNLADKNYEINILELEHGQHEPTINNPNIKFLGSIFNSKTVNETFFNKLTRKIKFITIKYFPKLMNKIYLKENYDIVISFNYLYPSFLISNLKGKKISWFHGSIEDLDYRNKFGLDKIKTKSLFFLQKKALEKVDKIIAISDITKDSILNIYPEFSDKLYKIYNGYDFNEIIEKSNTTHVQPIDVIAIGRLDSNKNFKYLIQAISLLKNEMPNINVKILGEGVEKDNLLNLINEKSLEKNIELLGYVSNPYPYIKASKLLALTSISEGFPTVIVEAMALGCPFISTNVGGVKELCNNNNCGIIISTPEELANNIKMILTDNNKLDIMRTSCSSYVQRYSLSNYITNICDLLEDRITQTNIGDC